MQTCQGRKRTIGPGLKRLFCHRTAVRTVVSENNSLFGEKRQHGDHTVGLQESRLESWNRGMNLGKWNNNSLTWIVGPFGDHFPYEPWFPGRGRSEVVMKFTQDQHGLFAEAPGTGWPHCSSSTNRQIATIQRKSTRNQYLSCPDMPSTSRMIRMLGLLVQHPMVSQWFTAFSPVAHSRNSRGLWITSLDAVRCFSDESGIQPSDESAGDTDNPFWKVANAKPGWKKGSRRLGYDDVTRKTELLCFWAVHRQETCHK